MRTAFQVLKFLDSVAALDSTGRYLNFFNVTEFKEFSSKTVIMKNFPVFQLCCSDSNSCTRQTSSRRCGTHGLFGSC